MGLEQIQVELQESMGNDRAIANAAWTSSYDKEKREARTEADVERIVKMLAESGHAVPFESVVFRFWMRIPIFTDRQHMTHRIASHNGLSGRYRTMPNDWYYLGPLDDVSHIVGRALNGLHNDPNVGAEWVRKYSIHCKEAFQYYKDILGQLKSAKEFNYINDNEYKRAREVLRGVLPQSGMTERTTIFNLRSFANYQRLRNSNHAQPEIQQVAKLMLQQVKEKGIAPIAVEALEKKGWII